jgi:ATP-dependent exoDNAse (exonuclease V) beta subunit
VILAEQGILLPNGGHRRPDRILIGEDKAVIVDFKTGEMSERYFNQVREYMDLVNKLTGKKVSGYLCYLESGIIEEVYA